MHIRLILFIFITILFTHATYAQELSFRDSIAAYDLKRIKKNITGAEVQGAWGIANMAAGGIGVALAKQDEWRGFHGVNAGFGVLNTVMAAVGIQRAARQACMRPDFEQAYNFYQKDKRRYLLNACLDMAYIISGVAVTKVTENTGDPVYRGCGRGLMLQGVGLLIFHNMMYAAQMTDNPKWYRIMNEIRFTGGGVGFNIDLSLARSKGEGGDM